jgi:Ser/Thr protein kinase RdoA (MazF antagonist)
MMNERSGKQEALARAAAAQYPVEVASLCLLGHSDNLTFRVDSPDGASYLLRIHQPVIAFYSGIRQLPEVIASELAWMEALSQEGVAGVQRPVQTREGNLVGTVDDERGQPVPTTLLTWLEGQHFSPSGGDVPGLITRFGELVARLHSFSAQWTPPPGFIRPSYDEDHFRRIFARLLRGADLDIFSERVFRILRSAGQSILTEIAPISREPQDWGMVHADLHVGNFLVHDDALRPIDFSLCGFGSYLFDLSVCLAGGLSPELRPHFLVGYRSQRPLPDTHLRTVDAYALAGRLSYYAYQIDNPSERSWLRQRIPQVAEGVCVQFLKGEPILLDL